MPADFVSSLPSTANEPLPLKWREWPIVDGGRRALPQAVLLAVALAALWQTFPETWARCLCGAGLILGLRRHLLPRWIALSSTTVFEQGLILRRERRWSSAQILTDGVIVLRSEAGSAWPVRPPPTQLLEFRAWLADRPADH